MSPNPFLPKGYEPPAQSGGRYLKITKNSEARVRIVSPSPILGWEYWTDDNKPRRLRERPATIPSDVRTSDDGSPEKLRHFWAMAVLDYADSTVKIWEVTQATIQRTIADLAGDEDWGHPSGYDLKIKRDDAIGRTTYAVAPVPHKPLSADAKRIVTETAVNLDALFDGGDPFLGQPAQVAQIAPPGLTDQQRKAARAIIGMFSDDPAPAQPEPVIDDQPETVTELPPMTDWQRNALHAAGSAYYGKDWDKRRAILVKSTTGGRTESSADLTADEANRLIDWINRKADADAAKTNERKAIDALPEVMSPSEYQDTEAPF